MIGNARFHRRSDAQTLMNMAEVVVHEGESNRCLQILDLSTALHAGYVPASDGESME
jgi:hypothetical protein